MIEPIARLLLRLSEAGEPALLWGRQTAAHKGHLLDRLLERGVLIEQPRATNWTSCIDCDCDTDERPIELIDGCHVAVCPFDHERDTVLSNDDLLTFVIEPDALIRELVRDLGLLTTPSEIMPGVWHCGRGPGDFEVCVTFTAIAALQPGLSTSVRETLRGSAQLLVGPPLPAADVARLVNSGVVFRSFDEVLRPEDLHPFHLDLTDLKGRSQVAVRLVVDKRFQSATIDGVTIDLPHAPFKLLVMLTEAAIAGARPVTAERIGTAFSLRSPADLIRELRVILQRAGLGPAEARCWIKTQRSPTRYLLTVSAEEIELRS